MDFLSLKWSSIRRKRAREAFLTSIPHRVALGSVSKGLDPQTSQSNTKLGGQPKKKSYHALVGRFHSLVIYGLVATAAMEMPQTLVLAA